MKRWTMRNRMLMVVLASWSVSSVVVVTACSSPKSNPVDSGALADHKGGWPDMDPVPKILVSVYNPYHLMTALPADFKGAGRAVGVDLFIYKVKKATALSQLQSAFSLVERKTRTPVQGVWTFDWRGNRFLPSTLADDTEYLIQVKKSGYLQPSREITAFRVGSLPRIVSVSFDDSSSKATEVDLFGIRFSEPVDITKVNAALEVKTTGVGAKVLATKVITPLSLSPTHAIGFQLPAGTSSSTKLSITLGTDVGAPTNVALDGKYTGMPNSGPFSIEVVPQDHLTSKNKPAWEPGLSL